MQICKLYTRRGDLSKVVKLLSILNSFVHDIVRVRTPIQGDIQQYHNNILFNIGGKTSLRLKNIVEERPVQKSCRRDGCLLTGLEKLRQVKLNEGATVRIVKNILNVKLNEVPYRMW